MLAGSEADATVGKTATLDMPTVTDTCGCKQEVQCLSREKQHIVLRLSAKHVGVIPEQLGQAVSTAPSGWLKQMPALHLQLHGTAVCNMLSVMCST